MSTPIVVVGSYNKDLVWYCDEFPDPGETVKGRFVSGPGGKGSNQAVAAARTGIVTTFVGAVGHDIFGIEARRLYDAEGINYQLAEYQDAPTGNAGIYVSGSGENTIVVDLGANLRLAPENLPESIIKEADIVVCQNEISSRTILHALQLARSNGVTSVLNPAPMTSEFDPACLEQVDILIPNVTEFLNLLRCAGPPLASPTVEKEIASMPHHVLHELCRSIGPDTVILTMGRRGCFISSPSEYKAIPGHNGIEIVDTTGAGDAFVGGFASGWVQFDKHLHTAAEYANAVAALSVTKHGTTAAMPHKEEIDSFFGTAREHVRPPPS